MSIRYPNDAIDRFWWRLKYDASNIAASSETIRLDQGPYDHPPDKVMKTNFVTNTTGFTFSPSNVVPEVWTISTVQGSHYYFVVLGFVELYPNVTAGM